MRSRLLVGVMALALSLAGLLVPASPASAGCGHNTHADEYNGGGIFWDGTNIRTGPHVGCTSLGIGNPGEGIDVHCAILSEHTNFRVWVFVRDLDDGTRGWAREDALRVPDSVAVHDCVSNEFILVTG